MVRRDTVDNKKVKDLFRRRKIEYFGSSTTRQKGVGSYNFSKDLFLHIRQNYNNIFLTVTDHRGCVRFMVSGGFSKLRGSNRVSHRSIDIISRIFMERLNSIKFSKFSFNNLNVVLITAKNQFIKLFLESLSDNIGYLKFFVARLKIPHNGMRPKKLRRV